MQNCHSRFVGSKLLRTIACVAILSTIGNSCAILVADDDSSEQKSFDAERLETMRAFVAQMEFTAQQRGFPRILEKQALFRYDDQARGYIDGTVWRLGEKGRPKAIVTAELHPKYDGAQRIVCDYLSLSDEPFRAKVIQNLAWIPTESAVTFKPLSDAPALSPSKPQRLFQLKKMAERFVAQQFVEGQKLELRLLPRPIDRYQPTENTESDAAVFLFVSGRNPGILLAIEATESEWKYGVGRLSGPSKLTIELDNQVVWKVDPANYSWNGSYTASNFPIVIPGIDPPPLVGPRRTTESE